MSLEISPPDDAPPFRDVITVLDDEDCRTIIAVLEQPMTVPEISEAAELPLSSTYRKLDRLTDARLVAETDGVRRGRHRKSRYAVDFDRVSIDLDDQQEFRVDITRSNRRSLDLWADVTREF
ncbi:helix-turn-helix domain-containing protein [Halosolutus gelatinilyticus]|uniref:helix-turn-helix domain-containing protein n=1 Tax=Halosolutus gelatinilyticus TaxID=2931975 RepID=UPI001FF65EB0|nr:helix-turn-helix domain-containing protein [Halosolutus gelatinilyticus]